MGDLSTPWRRVFAAFGVTQVEFARLLGRHRSKVSRALRDGKGLISGRDQEDIINAARKAGVSLKVRDLLPG